MLSSQQKRFLVAVVRDSVETLALVQVPSENVACRLVRLGFEKSEIEGSLYSVCFETQLNNRVCEVNIGENIAVDVFKFVDVIEGFVVREELVIALCGSSRL